MDLICVLISLIENEGFTERFKVSPLRILTVKSNSKSAESISIKVHCSAEGASKMRHLSATVLTSQNERFLYIFSQKIIFLKIRRALCELCRFVTIVYKRQFRGFPTLQLWTFWLQKKNFTKNY